MLANRVLFFSLSEQSGSSLIERLAASDVVVTQAASVTQAQRELLTRKYQLLVGTSDAVCSTFFELLRFIKKHNLPSQVIFNARSGSIEEAVSLMKAGANDFLMSDDAGSGLAESILRSLTKMRESDSRIRAEVDASIESVGNVFVGQSSAIREIRSALNVVAKSQTSVLITGESGTGKEIVAQCIHLQSDRSSEPFIALNCAALPKDVLENELFGHEKGAFTGALQKKAGCFEMADRGTLFFDEIGEMTPEIQAKLLRAIEEKTFRRLGGKEEIHVDVRTIAATNKNISTILKNQQLREDLYYRLSTIEIYIPPLRERKEDITLLLEHFLSVFREKYGKPHRRYTEECLEMLIAYDWPGNVRELRNVVERCVVICADELISSKFLPERISTHQVVRSQISIPLGCSAQEAERMLILETLASVQNNKSKAAKILGLSRKTLHNKLQFFSSQQE